MAELGALLDGGLRVGKLVQLLAGAAARHVTKHANYERLVADMLAHLPLPEDAQRSMADELVQLAAGAELAPEQGGEAAGDALLRALRAVDQRHPDAVDAAVGAAMGALQADDPRRTRLLAFLEAAYAGSARSPLREAGTTVLLAVDAPSAKLRQLVSGGAVCRWRVLPPADACFPPLSHRWWIAVRACVAHAHPAQRISYYPLTLRRHFGAWTRWCWSAALRAPRRAPRSRLRSCAA